MMPIDATSILGSIGGIAEIAKEAFGSGAGGQAASNAKRAASPVPPTSRT
jgi:hypothetical protein